MGEKFIEKYKVTADKVFGEVLIKKEPNEYVKTYELNVSKIEAGTLAVLDKVRDELISSTQINTSVVSDASQLQNMKNEFYEKGMRLLDREFPLVNKGVKEYLMDFLIHDMFGLGKLDMLIEDGNLEEIAVNAPLEFIWVYHKKYGWLKTNLQISDESTILNYASSIGRQVGRQISVLNPLMDAHLLTGDRVNATLFPISSKGNTMTIRKFRREPWTIIDMIQNKTVSSELVSFLWLIIQYEMNMIVSGGTGSGKTSFLGALTPFIQPNQRVISIEDTRELSLPKYLHWVPMSTREANAEGRGEVSMLDLLVNSLRMRPDRVIVGEIRKQREAEVLFEAMNTGHSVYATLHADTAEQTYRRLTNPPINLPESMLESLHAVVVCFRDRRNERRRIFQLSELVPASQRGENSINTNNLFRWKPLSDTIERAEDSYRLLDDLRMHTGMDEREMNQDLEEKRIVLEYMLKNNVRGLELVSKTIAEYYNDKDALIDSIKNRTGIGKPDLVEVVEGQI